MRIYIYLMMVFCWIGQSLYTQNLKNLEYEIEVYVKTIPIYAKFSSTGEPVMDLKKEDLLFYIGGKRIPISYLIKQDFLLEESTEKSLLSEKEKNILKRREIFIIMDCVFTPLYGTRRGKKIIKNIVNNCGKSDTIHIFSMTWQRGLTSILGPETDKKKILDVIKKTRFHPLTIEDSRSAIIFPVDEYVKSLSKIKGILKTYNQPKILYFISSGFQISSNSNLLQCKEIVKAIRDGGATLFSINPGMVKSLSSRGRGMLMYLSDQAGGDFIQATQIKKITQEIKRTNLAYYEMTFQIDPNIFNPNALIRIKSLREGVRIIHPEKIVLDASFNKVSKLEKRLFLLDATGKGKWSSSISSFKRAVYKIKELKKIDNRNSYQIVVQIPKEYQGKKITLYNIRLKNEGEKNQISKTTQYIKKNNLHIKIEGHPKDTLFFVLIEKKTRKALLGVIQNGLK